MTAPSFAALRAVVAGERTAQEQDPERPAVLRRVLAAADERAPMVEAIVPARAPREIDTGVSWIRIRETASGGWRVRFWIDGVRHSPMVFPTEALAVAYVERLKARTAGAK